MNNLENQVEEQDEDDLPFALSQEEQLESSQHSGHGLISPAPCSSDKMIPEEDTRIPVPQLASSIISNPTDGESQPSLTRSEMFMSESLSCDDSRYLDAAASLLFPHSSINTSTSCLNISHLSRNSLDATSPSIQCEVGYSQLLKKAEVSAKPFRSVVQEPLSVLPEDTSTTSPTPPSSPTISPRVDQHIRSLMQSQATILEGISSDTEQRLASLAGATAKRTSTNSFEVSVEISGGHSVMDVLGNPTLLPLWCDGIPSLVVTQCSDSSQRVEEGREYDAEWVEATSPYLVPPPNSSCFSSLLRTIQRSLGFPTFGRITMFVERQLGRVGLTIGTYDGGIDVCHKLRVHTLLAGKIRVTDEVRLLSEDVSGWNVLQSCFSPTLGDYMNQVLRSMARLRFLVESGESLGYTPPEMVPLL